MEAGGRSYKGNVFGGGTSVAGGAADLQNNVESVFLRPGTGGRFSVKVLGTSVPGDGLPGNGDQQDQDFALVVSNAEAASDSPLLVHDASTVSDGAGGDGDGTPEPGEPFTLDERVRNAGEVVATGVSGTYRAARA